MKQQKKKTSDKMSELNLELSKEKKKVKTLEKSLSKLEYKNENLADQVKNSKQDKNNNHKEIERLVKEMKTLQSKIPKLKSLSSIPTQTEPSAFSSSTSTDIVTETVDKNKDPERVACLVCTEVFETGDALRLHSEVEHDITIDLQKLTDREEENDDFTRMLKSMNVDKEYLNERVKYYPGHWDHIEERIKIRMVAKMKFEAISREISKNMLEENDTRKIYPCTKTSNRFKSYEN